MSNQSIEREVVVQLGKLPLEKQQQVLHFARALADASPLGIPGKDLLRFAETIELNDLQAMSQAIEEGCEKVNPNEW